MLPTLCQVRDSKGAGSLASRVTSQRRKYAASDTIRLSNSSFWPHLIPSRAGQAGESFDHDHGNIDSQQHDPQDRGQWAVSMPRHFSWTVQLKVVRHVEWAASKGEASSRKLTHLRHGHTSGTLYEPGVNELPLPTTHALPSV